MQRHATREDEVDLLLRGRVLVNLYDHVVRQGDPRVGRDLLDQEAREVLHARARGPHHRGRLLGRRVRALDGDAGPTRSSRIAAYNRDDCVSNLLLRDWLEARRLEAAAAVPGRRRPRPEPSTAQPPEELAGAAGGDPAAEEAPREGVPADRPTATPEQQARWLLAALLDWHRREAKPQWWDHFRLLESADRRAGRRASALGELRVRRATSGGSASQRPPATASTGPGDTASSEGDRPSTRRCTGQGRREQSSRSTTSQGPSTSSSGPIDARLQPGRPSSRRAHPDEPTRRAALACALADRRHRRRHRRRPGRSARPATSSCGTRPGAGGHADGPLARDRRERRSTQLGGSALALDGDVLPIQGPPGTGKTYTGRPDDPRPRRSAGKRVGVTAQSHRVDREPARGGRRGPRRAEGIPRPASQQCRDGDDDVERRPRIERIADERRGRAGLRSGRPGRRRRHVAGSGRARHGRARSTCCSSTRPASCRWPPSCAVAGARGLARPAGRSEPAAAGLAGIHPEGAGASALEHLVGEAKTIAPDRGLLLGTTYRLHPDVNAYISDAFYEGRLSRDPANARQHVADGEPVGGTGRPVGAAAARRAPATGRARRPTWIADAIEAARRAALGATARAVSGRSTSTTSSSSRRTTPRSRRSRRRSSGASAIARNVGTVDKFQGREAPVAIYSMTTSTPDDAPRDLEFLYSGNRLNVALSRARGLAVLVASPRCCGRCRTPEQMRLVNAFCRLVEVAARSTAARRPAGPTWPSCPTRPLVVLSLTACDRVGLARSSRSDRASPAHGPDPRRRRRARQHRATSRPSPSPRSSPGDHRRPRRWPAHRPRPSSSARRSARPPWPR